MVNERKSNGRMGFTLEAARELGRKGGLTVRDERGSEWYQEIGRRGAYTTNLQRSRARVVK